MSQVQIRPLRSHEELRACERIQQAVWGSVGVSSELMKVTQKYGGIVLGAVENGKLLGFIYALLARRNGRLIHWSHLMAVRPGLRGRGLGFRMKLAHRKLALAQGITSICWTFDPLQSRNAALNVARLGASAEEYIEDCYGRFPSAIEKGLPSDRFVMNWHIATKAVERRLRFGPPPEPGTTGARINETALNSRGFLEIRRVSFELRRRRLLLEIPVNTDEMRSVSLPLARRWRFEARAIFQKYLAVGYRVRDFTPPSAASGGRCYYALIRGRKRSQGAMPD